MSRSFKKSPVCKQTYRESKTVRWYKRQASKVVRKNNKITNGKAYKKYYLRYNICEFRFYCTLDDWLNSYNRFVKNKKIELWERWYLRK